MTSSPEFWCAESLVVTINGPQGRATTVVDKPYARVGSHERSEILLSGPGIDARSLYLHATSEGVFCVRLQASDGGTLGSGSWLGANEWLRVGPYGISARLQREAAGPPPRVGLTVWGSAPPPLPVCEISSQGRVRDKRRFRARLNLIGRRKELALQMLGLEVSSCHCALFWKSGELWCIDLLSSNGTLLDGEAIDCARIEIGSSLLIGEFSLKFKRLSRSTPRQSSWRTGDSEEEIPPPPPASAEDEPPADIWVQTASVATGATDEAEPETAEPADRQEVSAVVPQITDEAEPDTAAPPFEPDLQPQVVPASEPVVASHEELRRDRPEVEEESPDRSLRLRQERQELELQRQRAHEEVAEQVSLLQSESALLAAQRQELATLRGEFETQRRALSQDLVVLQQQASQRQSPPESPQPAALVDLALASLGLETSPAREQETLQTAEPSAEQEAPPANLLVSQSGRSAPATQPDSRTIIEASYVIEKEAQPSSAALRSWPSPDPNASADIGRSRPVGDDKHSLAIMNPVEASRAAKDGNSSLPRVIGRKAVEEPDELGAFVADRLTPPDSTRRWWLPLLWSAAALATLAALIALGYFVLSTP